MKGMGRGAVVIAPDSYLRVALQRYLQREGFDVSTAAEVGEATVEAERADASLFVLDLNGTAASAELDLLKRLSRSGSLVYLAENGSRAPIERLARLTDGLVLSKPLSFDDLGRALSNIL
jgi:DNA-binding response OmpR family regulator